MFFPHSARLNSSCKTTNWKYRFAPGDVPARAVVCTLNFANLIIISISYRSIVLLFLRNVVSCTRRPSAHRFLGQSQHSSIYIHRWFYFDIIDVFFFGWVQNRIRIRSKILKRIGIHITIKQHGTFTTDFIFQEVRHASCVLCHDLYIVYGPSKKSPRGDRSSPRPPTCPNTHNI